MARPISGGSHYTAGNEHEFVLFRIGMRLNAVPGWRGLRETLGILIRMPIMLLEQEKSPAIGMLSSQIGLSWPNIEFTQFWRSYEDLERYASGRDQKHAPAWSWWSALANKTGAVGFWHETYKIAPGTYESVYIYMPRYSLAKQPRIACSKNPKRARDNG